MKIANNLIAWGTWAGVLLTTISLLVATIAYAVHLGDQANASQISDTDHESRLRSIETRVIQVDSKVTSLKADVTWLRENTPARAAQSDPGLDSLAAP
jgi:hypothetical protein